MSSEKNWFGKGSEKNMASDRNEIDKSWCLAIIGTQLIFYVDN